MPFLYQLGEKLEEVCEQKQAYVHSVDIGVGGYNHVVVAQVVDAVLYVEGPHAAGRIRRSLYTSTRGMP